MIDPPIHNRLKTLWKRGDTVAVIELIIWQGDSDIHTPMRHNITSRQSEKSSRYNERFCWKILGPGFHVDATWHTSFFPSSEKKPQDKKHAGARHHRSTQKGSVPMHPRVRAKSDSQRGLHGPACPTDTDRLGIWGIWRPVKKSKSPPSLSALIDVFTNVAVSVTKTFLRT